MNEQPEKKAVAIRPARPDDYDEIVRLWQASGLAVSLRGRESREAFHRQLAVFPDLFLVATEGGRIVGSVLGTHDHRKGWINRLAVAPLSRRHGIAVALADACDAAIRAHGIDIVAALVEPENTASRALFERLGYVADVPVVYFRRRSHPDV